MEIGKIRILTISPRNNIYEFFNDLSTYAKSKYGRLGNIITDLKYFDFENDYYNNLSVINEDDSKTLKNIKKEMNTEKLKLMNKNKDIYNENKIKLFTHKIQGLTESDFIFAFKINKIIEDLTNNKGIEISNDNHAKINITKSEMAN